mmetsp:Transcript_7477/g.23543  ORF Transcript_7477/g.23543 Transcript_7477/m.23543 type:complete len:250 (-) Transcript_7477:1034-1783(-)
MEDMFNTMKADFNTQLSAQRAEFQAKLDHQARSQTIATDAGSNAGRQPASQPFGRDVTGAPAVNFRQAHKSPPEFDSTITLDENLRNLFAKIKGVSRIKDFQHWEAYRRGSEAAYEMALREFKLWTALNPDYEKAGGSSDASGSVQCVGQEILVLGKDAHKDGTALSTRSCHKLSTTSTPLCQSVTLIARCFKLAFISPRRLSPRRWKSWRTYFMTLFTMRPLSGMISSQKSMRTNACARERNFKLCWR